MIRKTLTWLVAAALLAVGAEAAPAEKTAPDFSLPDADGKTHKLSQYRGKWVVLEWTNYDCPYVKKHYNAPTKNMQALQAKYTAQGVVWLSICSSGEGKQGYMTQAVAAKRRDALGAKPTALLLDPEGKIGRVYDARTTPDMRVVNPSGQIVYWGAIDSVKSKSSEDIAGATNFVAQTLDKALAGQSVSFSYQRPYG